MVHSSISCFVGVKSGPPFTDIPWSARRDRLPESMEDIEDERELPLGRRDSGVIGELGWLILSE